MRGLLEKDIRLLLHSKQTFLCFIALVIVLGVTQKNPFWFLHFLMMRWIMDLPFYLRCRLTEKCMSEKNICFVWEEQSLPGLLR